MEQKVRQRKRLVGTVVSDKMDKTVVVRVDTLVRHPQYHKFVNRSTKFKAHDGENACGVGDRVQIVESRPLSKDKRWRVEKILEKAVL
jgi:small subunit ribosomal protein S17